MVIPPSTSCKWSLCHDSSPPPTGGWILKLRLPLSWEQPSVYTWAYPLLTITEPRQQPVSLGINKKMKITFDWSFPSSITASLSFCCLRLTVSDSLSSVKPEIKVLTFKWLFYVSVWGCLQQILPPAPPPFPFSTGWFHQAESYLYRTGSRCSTVDPT